MIETLIKKSVHLFYMVAINTLMELKFKFVSKKLISPQLNLCEFILCE